MRRSNRIVLIFVLGSWIAVLAANANAGADPFRRPGRPHLTPQERAEGTESFRAFGSDPYAPRDLVLWTWRNETFTRVADNRSNDKGRFDFGEIPVPIGGLYLDVSVRGMSPDLDSMIYIEHPIPAPQVASTLQTGSLEISVYPALFEGELRIRDAANRRLLLRVPIDGMQRGAMTIDLALALGLDLPSAILIHQVLADGRESPAAYFRLALFD